MLLEKEKKKKKTNDYNSMCDFIVNSFALQRWSQKLGLREGQVLIIYLKYIKTLLHYYI